MNNFKLPEELILFLKKKRSLKYDPDECECGETELKQLEELELSEFYIDFDSNNIQPDDPHQGEEGYYVVKGVDLISECDGFDPEGILIWLPDYQMFGAWDSDHYNLTLFNDTDWEEIVEDPVQYLNAQWDPTLAVEMLLDPWEKCEFKKGRPF